jgi:hypothetical protein
MTPPSSPRAWLVLVLLLLAPASFVLGWRQRGALEEQRPAAAPPQVCADVRAERPIDHITRAKALVRSSEPGPSTDGFDWAVALLDSEPSLAEAEGELALAGDDRLFARMAGELRREIVARRARIDVLRPEFDHLLEARKIIRSAEHIDGEDSILSMKRLVRASARFPEALEHLSRISPSSPFAPAVAEFRQAIERRKASTVRLRWTEDELAAGSPSARVRRRRAHEPGNADESGLGFTGAGSYADAPLNASGPVHVRDYTRKDGTFVRAHTRSR